MTTPFVIVMIVVTQLLSVCGIVLNVLALRIIYRETRGQFEQRENERL